MNSVLTVDAASTVIKTFTHSGDVMCSINKTLVKIRLSSLISFTFCNNPKYHPYS